MAKKKGSLLSLAIQSLTYNDPTEKRTFENIEGTRAANCRKIPRLTASYNHPRNFIAIASIVLEICT